MVGKLVDIGGFSWSCHDFWTKIDVLPGPTQTWDEFQVFLGNFAFGPKVCATSHAPAGARGLRGALSGNHL